jgi:hypothetical protein
MKKLLTCIACLLLMLLSQAQNDTTVVTQAATGLRANGKIWVVMAVCVTILVGLFIYLISLDRKISKLEKH